MKIGITGDTHGSKKAMRLVLGMAPPVDYWFHTGDYSQDGKFLAYETKLPLLSVAGNTDPADGKANIDELRLPANVSGLRMDTIICMAIKSMK